MALTLNVLAGAETGGLVECSATVGAPTASSSSPITGDYSYQVNQGDNIQFAWAQDVAIASTTGYIIGFRMQLIGTDQPSAAEYFLINENSGGSWLAGLRLETTGDLVLWGAVDYATITRPFTVGQTYRIVMKWDRSTTGSYKLWIDGSLMASGTGNFDNAASEYLKIDLGWGFNGTSSKFDDINAWTGSTSDADILLYPEVYRYQNRTNAVTSDIGSNLGAGVWQSVGETPLTGDADANAAQFTATGATGAIYTNDTASGLNGRSGPNGDTKITSTAVIKGCRGIWRIRKGTSTGNHVVRLGNNVDGVTDTTKTLTTSYANYFVISTSAAVVPQATEYFAQGFGTTGAADALCTEQWAMLLIDSLPIPPQPAGPFGLPGQVTMNQIRGR